MSQRIEVVLPTTLVDLAREERLGSQVRKFSLYKAELDHHAVLPDPEPSSLASAVSWAPGGGGSVETLVASVARDRVQLLRFGDSGQSSHRRAAVGPALPEARWGVVGLPLASAAAEGEPLTAVALSPGHVGLPLFVAVTLLPHHHHHHHHHHTHTHARAHALSS